ncbi:hypothetical protein [Streptomyces sp. BPTC-684]|uniref:hypothetical protein n=1 Tax=Streptomyces sp. BPTC-684 TaxID=3043734 RepID=UPI0024B0991E|nr:hypothetical protein [Streptomyces sp. BPTC-684]WHM40889.1 hypothetical protein QIY60_31085 [Streptomyces sp. BPTC-684]
MYEAAEDAAHSLVLRHVGHTAPDDSLAGWFADPAELHGGDPAETPWREADPDRLTLTRNGTLVHQGRHILARDTDTAEPRLTTAISADGTIEWAIVQERQHTPAEYEDLEQKVIARGVELAARAGTRNGRTRGHGPLAEAADLGTGGVVTALPSPEAAPKEPRTGPPAP